MNNETYSPLPLQLQQEKIGLIKGDHFPASPRKHCTALKAERKEEEHASLNDTAPVPLHLVSGAAAFRAIALVR